MKTNRKLNGWLRKKYKIGYRKAVEKLNTIRQANPALFYHWKMGYRWSISRITRAVWQETVTYGSVRGLGVKLPLAYSVVLMLMKGLEELVPEEKVRKRKGIVHINHEFCKRCGICVNFCPVKNLEIQHQMLMELERCIACKTFQPYFPAFSI